MEQTGIIKTEVKTLFKVEIAYETTLEITTKLGDRYNEMQSERPRGGKYKRKFKGKWKIM